MTLVLNAIKDLLRPALTRLTDDVAPLLELVRPAQDARFGDYQINCAMPLAKQLGRPPRELAQEIVENAAFPSLCEKIEVAGPGFINLRLRTDWLAEQVAQLRLDPRCGTPLASSPRTYVVDYSSPNVAKPMHVGHIRSTVIGDALARLLTFVGHRVIRDNHLGDWGTQFGMILYGYRHFVDAQAYADHPVEELGRLYRLVRRLMDYHDAITALPKLELRMIRAQQEIERSPTDARSAPAANRKAAQRCEAELKELREERDQLDRLIQGVQGDPAMASLAQAHPDIGQQVLAETARLHEGDPARLSLWQEFLPKCRDEIQQVYDRLQISFDVELGESFYQPRLATVVSDLQQRGLARESEGAVCVFLDGFNTPMIVRKQDGAFLYATSDLATIQYRREMWHPDAILYVVDSRQSEHFEKLFAAARLWGYTDIELRHVSFGTVLGEDNRPFKTRSGDTVGLTGLLDEAVHRAAQVVAENDDQQPTGPQLSVAQRDHIAHVIGYAAIKYADLSQNRTSDYVFSYDKMVALQGNTATYMQYSYARIQNIFARGGIDRAQLAEDSRQLSLSHPSERQLALQLVRFAETIDEVLIDYRPNLLTNYLYELAKSFSDFYRDCSVLNAESDDIRGSRLLLSDATGRVLRQGLALLGIDVVDKM